MWGFPAHAKETVGSSIQSAGAVPKLMVHANNMYAVANCISVNTMFVALSRADLLWVDEHNAACCIRLISDVCIDIALLQISSPMRRGP